MHQCWQSGKPCSGFGQRWVATTFDYVGKSEIKELKHLNPDTRNTLAGNVMEILQEALSEQLFLPISSDVLKTIVKSELIVGRTNVTSEDYDEICNALKISTVIGDITKRVLHMVRLG